MTSSRPEAGAPGGPPLAFVGARLVDPASGFDGPGGAILADGAIRDCGAHLARAGAVGAMGIEVVDCAGLTLAPGLVDMRVQLREPGEEHKETIATASAAAAAGGVTTMAALPNTKPPIDNAALVESIVRRARETARVRIHTYAALTRGLAGKEIVEMGLLAEAGAIGFTDAIRAVADSLVMRRALSYAKSFGRPIVQHPEDPALATGAINEGEIATRLGLPGIPSAAETIMVERDLRLVELTGGRYHVAHLSTASAIDAVRRAKARGLEVTADTAPPYFALNETAIGDYRTFAKLSPPLRSEEDRRAVIAGLADGTIDAIASDHSPHDQDAKRQPMAQAAFGGIGLETLLPLVLEAVHNKHLSLIDALGALTVRPARILGLTAGRIAKGAPADLILIDIEVAWKVEKDKLRSKSKNSPFDGRPVQGRVVRTTVGGATIHRLTS